MMKQVIQNYRTGKIELAEVPVPLCKPGYVLVRNINSVISVGTEKSIIQLGREGLIQKAKSRPEQFMRAVEKAKNEGFFKVWKEAMERLDEPKPLGYSAAGEVIEVGQGVRRFEIGDRVACIGTGFASHATVICLPECLCMKIPEGLGFEEAAFGMIGIIALHGIICAEVKPGEKVAVLGLGLIGQITAQLLKAYGCNVIGADIEESKLRLAELLGCDQVVLTHDVERAVLSFAKGKGVDKIIITASSKDNSLIKLSALIARFRAKIVLVGVVDIHIPRETFWRKELEFQVSKAGGYDPLLAKQYDHPKNYKKASQDAHLKEFLGLVQERRVRLKPLVTHRFNITDALSAYKMITDKHPKENYIAVIFEYKNSTDSDAKVNVSVPAADKKVTVYAGVVGAGLFGRSTILPILKKFRNLELVGIATTKGNTSRHTADKFNFGYCTTDYKQILEDKKINTIFILTRHDLHAKIVKEALEANKNIFVEKPLATNVDDLKMLYRLMRNNVYRVMVGFNRRFSPLAVKLKDRILDKHFPLIINIQVNAGNVPRGHWVLDEKEGGGRIIGEVCHFVDLAQFFTRAKPQSVFTQNIVTENKMINAFDNSVSAITFDDGSICSVVYTSIGDRSYPREKITVFDSNAVYEIDDFRTLKIYRPRRRKRIKLFGQDLGYRDELWSFLKDIQDNSDDIRKLKEGYFSTTLTTLKMMESLETGKSSDIRIEELID